MTIQRIQNSVVVTTSQVSNILSTSLLFNFLTTQIRNQHESLLIPRQVSNIKLETF